MSDRMNDLREEARRLSEPFSAALHARVMAAVRAEASPVAVRQSHPWRYAFAAAAVIAVAAGAWLLTRPAVQPSPTPHKQIVRDFRLESPLPAVALTLNTDAGNPAYAYLDHDAKALGRYLARQLDSLPRNP